MNSEKRQAIELLNRSILDQLDEVWAMKKRGEAAEVSRLILKEMCSVLQELPSEMLECFHSDLILNSENRTPPNGNLNAELYVELVAKKKSSLISQLRALLAA